MNKQYAWIAALILGLALVAGCGGKTVTRTAVNETIDLSGKWNDSDSRLVAEDLVDQITSAAWIEDFRGENGRKPALIFGNVRNKTSEHIAVSTFVKELDRFFTNGGRVKVVVSPDERDQIRTERADQQEFASQESMKQWGRELGADFMFIGEINLILDREGGDEVRYYQVDCNLVDLQDNTKVWAGFKKIKKLVER